MNLNLRLLFLSKKIELDVLHFHRRNSSLPCFSFDTVTTRATLGTFSFKRKPLCHKNMAERSVHVIVKPVLAKLIENL